jgi:oxalate decarboxylase/phosphoglucose isomerase-like protein (cupin superfamily)
MEGLASGGLLDGVLDVTTTELADELVGGVFSAGPDRLEAAGARGVPGAGLTFGEVVLLPGRGHDRHNHPTAEEILYVLSGEGEQMVSDQPPFKVKAGDTIYVPRAEYHSTLNTGWQTMRLLALYNPAGAEHALEGRPDFAELPPGQRIRWTRE